MSEAIAKNLEEHIAPMRARIKELEDRPPMSYQGTWSALSVSKAGSFYTDKGSVWFCRENTLTRPGESDCFVLAVKRGADGKNWAPND